MTDLLNVPLHFETFGQGYPLIVLHGLFGSLANWRPLARQWGQSFQVFALDQRNHGRSPHSDVWNYHVMAEDVRAFMHDHHLASAYLLGHSLGGKTAMQFALTYPDLVDKLIVVDMSPRFTRPRHQEILDALQALDLGAARNRRELDARLAPLIANPTLRQFLLMNVATGDDGHLHWRMNLDAIADHYDEVNKAIEPQPAFDKPALFIRGEQSDYIGDEDVAVIETLFSQLQIVTIANAGHWVHAEAPDEFSRVVMGFFNE